MWYKLNKYQCYLTASHFYTKSFINKKITIFRVGPKIRVGRAKHNYSFPWPSLHIDVAESLTGAATSF